MSRGKIIFWGPPEMMGQRYCTTVRRMIICPGQRMEGSEFREERPSPLTGPRPLPGAKNRLPASHGSQRIPYCQVVGNTSADYKDMPNRVMVRQFSPAIKGKACRIRHPAQNKQGQAERWKEGEYFFNSNDAQPAHKNIKGDRDLPKFRDIKNLHEDSQDGQRPNNSQNAPSPRAAEVEQHERRIGPRDQKENRRVIYDFEGLFHSGPGKA